MNLAQANVMSLLAKAGRKAITEKSRIVAHPELHKVLKYQGFHVQSTKPGQSSYIHPKTGAKATVKDTGEWNVTYPKPAEMQKIPGKRLGKKPPAKVIAKPKIKAVPSTKMKVAAGGPGSGRHPGAAIARDYGWKKQSALGGHLSMYHPAKPGHILELEPDERWVHSTGPGGSAYNYIEDQGQGIQSLHEHLKKSNFSKSELRRERKITEPW